MTKYIELTDEEEVILSVSVAEIQNGSGRVLVRTFVEIEADPNFLGELAAEIFHVAERNGGTREQLMKRFTQTLEEGNSIQEGDGEGPWPPPRLRS